jgi:hypothetical protein
MVVNGKKFVLLVLQIDLGDGSGDLDLQICFRTGRFANCLFLCPTLDDKTYPVFAIEDYLICIQLSVKASTDLSLPMAIEAEYCEILLAEVRRILVQVMDLNGLPLHPADAASSVLSKQDTRRNSRWNLDSLFGHSNRPLHAGRLTYHPAAGVYTNTPAKIATVTGGAGREIAGFIPPGIGPF